MLQMELYADRRRLHVSLRLHALAASRQGLQGFPASEQGLTFVSEESEEKDSKYIRKHWKDLYLCSWMPKIVLRVSGKTRNQNGRKKKMTTN